MKTALRMILTFLLCITFCVCLLPEAFAAEAVTISFDGNGATGGYMSPQYVTKGETAMLYQNGFTRTNWIFDSWNTKADGSGTSYANQGDIAPTTSLTLYAQWAKVSFSVIYDKNGGGGTMTPDSFPAGTKGTVRENAFYAPSAYTKMFGEWNTNPDGSGDVYYPGDSIPKDNNTRGLPGDNDVPDITLYAMWRDILEIWYYPGNGAGGTATKTKVPGGSLVKLPTPTSLGFTAPANRSFAGWHIEATPDTELHKAGEEYSFTSAVTVTAIWADTIIVTFEPNAATYYVYVKQTQSIPKDIDTELTPMSRIGYTYTGYKFKGWGLSPGSTTPKYTDGDTVKFSGDTTLYAIWEKHDFTGTVTITGEVSGSSTSAYTGETLTAKVRGENVFTKYTYQWKANGVNIPGATVQTYGVQPGDFGKALTCEVTATEAPDNKTRSSNTKIVSIDESEKRIVNNGQIESDYIAGLTEDMTYSINGVNQGKVSGISMPVTQQGIYRFYKGSALVGAVEVENWYTVGYVNSTSSSTSTTSIAGYGTITAKASYDGSEKSLTTSTTIKDTSTGEVVLQPYTSVGGYDHVWIVKQDSGVGFYLTVKPASGSYGQVSLNNGNYDSSSAERTYHVDPVNTYAMYSIVFNKSGSMPMPSPDFVLPASLTAIGDEAFTGGAFTYVRLPESCASIGKNAFANCTNLTYIYIPAATTQIDPSAFGNRMSLTIFGKTGSTAETFANIKGFTFVAVS